MKNLETTITIQLVNSGYILTTPVADGNSVVNKTEVFTSTGKLNKAVRTAVEEFSLVKTKADSEDKDAE